jgi:hypothetical protein
VQLAHLTEEETQEVLLRASEIAGIGAKQDSNATSIEAFLTAATEAGIPRAALEQALRERSITPRTWAVGERVFAKSADGKFYLAHVLAAHDASYQVQFLRGGQATVAVDEVTSGQLLPGQRVICDWPGWGPWECTVVSYDETAEKIRASDGWTNVKTFPISEIRISAPRGKKHAESSGMYWLYSALVLGGGAVGSVITWWLTR